MENLQIKDLIHSVREELIASQKEREEKGLDPLFYVDNLKIEVNFVVEKTKQTSGGFNLKIIDVGRDVTYADQQIHKIVLELKTFQGKESIPAANLFPQFEIPLGRNPRVPLGGIPGIMPKFRKNPR